MNEFRVQVPEGYEIDEENSTFECIKFKPKEEPTYDDIVRKLFCNSSTYWINMHGAIYNSEDGVGVNYKDKANAVSEKQCERILAINQLMNIAYYFNEIVDKDVKFTYKFIPEINLDSNIVIGYYIPERKNGMVYFKKEESAKKAIKILGEETVKLAISL